MSLSALMYGVAQEEGNNYNAIGKITKNGDRAYGKYQVMGENIPDWTREALGFSLSPEQFRGSPQAQEAVAKLKLGQYLASSGSPAGAANLWFTGKANPNPNVSDANGTTAAQYAANVTRNMGGVAPAGRIDPSQMSDDADPLANATSALKNGAIANAASGIAPKPVQATLPDVAGRIDPSALNDASDPLAAASKAIGSPSGAMPTQITPPAANAQIGQNGLLWDANGGHDPKTGELVIAGKPMSTLQHPQMLAGAMGVLGGVPIAGPYLQSGVEKAAAAYNTLSGGAPYADNLSQVQQDVSSAQSTYPHTATAGNVLGSVAGTIPAMEAAPAAFGVGGGPLLSRMITSGVTGGALGAADSVARNGLDPTAALRGAEFGGAFGAAGPLAGRAIGAGVDYASNALANTTPAARNVANVLGDIGMSPADAAAALSRMGPNATLADIDPALTAEAGGLAQTGGNATSTLRNAMASRAAGADDRVSQAVSTALGPRPDITSVKEGIVSDAQKAAAPYYTKAANSAQPMDATPVLSSIDAQLQTAAPKGGEAAVLNKVRGFLTQDVVAGPNGESMTVPQDDPQALLKARQEVDGMIDGLQRNGSIDGTTAGKNAFRAAVNVRGQIDGLLKSDPNIAAGDAAFASKMGEKDALDEGSALLAPGTRVEDVTRSVAGKTPQEIDAMRQGALSTIHDSLDNARQGDLSAARSLFAKSTANRAKLDALFPNSGQLFDSLDSEIAQRNTENVVRSGSQTAANQAIQAKYAPPASSGNALDVAAPIVGQAIGGGAGAAGASAAQRVFNALRSEYTNATLSRLREGTARGLSSTGPDLGNFLGQIGRAYKSGNVANALSNGSDQVTNAFLRSLAAPTQNALSGR